MVDIKRQDITLQDWTKGISSYEFAWGSYFDIILNDLNYDTN